MTSPSTNLCWSTPRACCSKITEHPTTLTKHQSRSECWINQETLTKEEQTNTPPQPNTHTPTNTPSQNPTRTHTPNTATQPPPLSPLPPHTHTRHATPRHALHLTSCLVCLVCLLWSECVCSCVCGRREGGYWPLATLMRCDRYNRSLHFPLSCSLSPVLPLFRPGDVCLTASGGPFWL